jgi:hypothetical protein
MRGADLHLTTHRDLSITLSLEMWITVRRVTIARAGKIVRSMPDTIPGDGTYRGAENDVKSLGFDSWRNPR